MRLKLGVLVFSLFVALVPCFAAELSPASRAQIDALLNRLGESGCQFNRNGTWYGSVEAKAHLVRKLNYMLDKKLVESPEQFIAVAASTSSMSGQNYLVKCQSEQAVPSATWLTAQLQALRVKRAPLTPPAK